MTQNTTSRCARDAPICKAVGVPSDEQIEAAIEAIETEREQLRAREGATGSALEADTARLEEIRVHLDLLWDLLRRRRALRDAGHNPDTAAERPPSVVERYWQ